MITDTPDVEALSGQSAIVARERRRFSIEIFDGVVIEAF